jgi:hypothetical protein
MKRLRIKEQNMESSVNAMNANSQANNAAGNKSEVAKFRQEHNTKH